jgi:hypothetical protein
MTLAYFPFWFQTKLVFGAQIPLCIVGGAAVGSIMHNYLSVSTRRWLPISLAVISIPLIASTPIHILFKLQRFLAANDQDSYFITDDVMKGFDFLSSRNTPNDLVFADISTSRLIPAFSGNTVLWGHWAQTIDLQDRGKWLQSLFNPQSDWNDQSRRITFWGSGIEYIFATAELKQNLDAFPSHWRVILMGSPKVFENPSVIIYQRPGTLPPPHYQ